MLSVKTLVGLSIQASYLTYSRIFLYTMTISIVFLTTIYLFSIHLSLQLLNCVMSVIFIKLLLDWIGLEFISYLTRASTILFPPCYSIALDRLYDHLCVSSLSVCLSVYVSSLSRSHFLSDFDKTWHRRLEPEAVKI